MSNPFNLSKFTDLSLNDTMGQQQQQPPVLNSSDIGFTPSNDNTASINISLNSPRTPSTQYHITRRLHQLSLHQQPTMSDFQRSNLMRRGISHSLVQQHKAVNINISVRNNSSITINLLNNNEPTQLTVNSTDACASSSLVPTQPSHFNHSFPILSSMDEPMSNNFLEISKTTRVLACQRNKIPGSSHHQMPSFNSIPQSNGNPTYNNLQTKFFTPLGMNSPMNNSSKGKEINLDGENGTFQTNLPTYSKSPFTKQYGNTPQLPDPDPTTSYISASPLRSFPPLKNMTTGLNQSTQHSRARRKSHPYKKYGPYTCPHCHVTFEIQQCYAAHMGSHYRNESAADRKKRREAKVRKRDLHIAESASGRITIAPGFLQEENSQAPSNTDGQMNVGANHGESFHALECN